MSFASHDLPDEPETTSTQTIVAPAACPLDRYWPLRLIAKRKKPSGVAARFAVYGTLGSVAFVTLFGVKCILLYSVLPALVVGYFTSGPAQSTSKESAHAPQVPASCPITGLFHERKPPERKPVDVGSTLSAAALGDAQGADPATAR